jgi:signal transduction histidine kinase
MSPLSSIRFKVIIIIALLMVIPVLILGGTGLYYYQGVVRQNIGSDNLGQSKAISTLTDYYVNLGKEYLNSFAVRPLLISAIESSDSTFLNVSANYAAVESTEFHSVFVTDASGKVLSFGSEHPDFPYASEVGKNYSDKPFVSQVLKTHTSYVSDGIKDLDGLPTIFVGVPIIDNNTTIGALVGAVDLTSYRNIVLGTQAHKNQDVYLVNNSGHVMMHSNTTYMDNMADFSTLPAVNNVLKGSEGVVEQKLPPENSIRLVAYTPITKYGWGVVVSVPTGIAYQPITESAWYLLAFLIVLLIGAMIASVIFGDSITRPLLRISSATAKIPETSPDVIEKELPLGRKDEFGSLARSILAMAKTISLDRTRILSARDEMEKEKERAEDEKQRAELYVDVMGHDINNLNQAALANMEILQNTAKLTDNEKEMINNAITSVMSSAGIIDNVRKLQKITGEELHREKVDIDQMIQACINETYRPEGKKVVIRYTPKKGLYVIGTPLLKEVFCNLIDNSIKYSREEVQVDIGVKETQTDGRKIYEVSVSDNGYGIPDETKEKLFRRFQRGTTKARGKGLGLYIVKKLLEKFGGSIQIKDRVAGDYSQGTMFVVTLPVADGE